MTTKLNGLIRREIEIDGQSYTVVVSDAGVILTKKRFRSGAEITWRELLMRHPENER